MNRGIAHLCLGMFHNATGSVYVPSPVLLGMPGYGKHIKVNLISQDDVLLAGPAPHYIGRIVPPPISSLGVFLRKLLGRSLQGPVDAVDVAINSHGQGNTVS